ncbi:MAG: glycosyltransferase involved in cell wall biosynthesis [Vicingaceae bacterium]|jgi:glycosyltransferase involved in cell wall biosynthesis
MGKQKVIIVGKLPPPYIGPAVATNIILNSALKDEFDLLHLNTKVNESIDDFGKGGIGKLFKNSAIYWRLFRLLGNSRADVILIPISQTTLGFLKDSIIILIASLFPTKILLQLRGSNFKNWINSTNSITEKYVRFCMNRTNGMMVLGENLRHLFEDYYTPEHIYVVPNGCNITIPKRNIESTKVQLLYFANFLPSKGIKEILKALVILKMRGIDTFEMTAVGAWDSEVYKKECMGLVEKNQLEVHFHDPMSGDQKWQTFANADVFLFTPNGPEGHPWVIVEGLAAGLPIISTNQGAIVESVIDKQNGIILSDSRPNTIAKELELLILNKEQRIEMGKASKAHYDRNFTEAKMVENISNTIHQILN